MSKRQKEGEVKLPPEYKLVAYIAPIGVVTEGSKVQLDASQSYLESVNANNDDGNKMLKSTTATRPLKDEDGVSYLWRQIEGPKVKLDNQDSSMPSFTAPYLDLGGTPEKIHTILKFQLIIRHKIGLLSEPYQQKVVVKIAQRALVRQGGGALGAYELGVFKALCEDIARKNEKNNNKNNRMLFDIVAGTSIGAVNAATIVGTVLNYKRDHPQANKVDMWKHSAEELEKFWTEISDPFTLIPKEMRDNPLYSNWLSSWKNTNELGGLLLGCMWDFGKYVGDNFMRNYNRNMEIAQKQIGENWPLNWPYLPVFTEDWPYFTLMSWKKTWDEEWPYIWGYFYWPKNYGSLATSEAARRYYTYIGSLFYGVPKVLLPGISQPDMKFPLSLSPTFTRFDNSPLSRTVKRYWDYNKYPIKTSFDKHEPRLILVSVDMLDATTAVAFDSYATKNNICVTEYGDNDFKHIIEYPDGITIEHVIASMSTHLRYKYQDLKVKDNDESGKEEEKGRGQGEGESRLFWDGAYLSNTPLRELLHLHKNYWQDVRKETVELEDGGGSGKTTIITLAPDLEIYIVNLYPTIEKEVPMDPDAIQDREIDIKFHDRTKYDVKVAEMTTDYLELIEQLINIGYKHSEDDNAFKHDLEKLLGEKTKSKKRSGEKRTYQDILDGRADITKVVYIDRRDDGNTIFGKAFEFSSKTIKELEAAGYNDAKIAIQAAFLRNAIMDLHDKSVLTENEESSLDQKLSQAMIYTKHEYPKKATVALDGLIDELGHISANNKEAPERRNALSELSESARILLGQLTR